jgi:hypothetical protein
MSQFFPDHPTPIYAECLLASRWGAHTFDELMRQFEKLVHHA